MIIAAYCDATIDLMQAILFSEKRGESERFFYCSERMIIQANDMYRMRPFFSCVYDEKTLFAAEEESREDFFSVTLIDFLTVAVVAAL